MLRALALILACVAVAAVFFAWRTGEEKARSLGSPERRDTPTPARKPENSDGAEKLAVEPSPGEQSCPKEKREGIRIGSFEKPESVPEYGILEKKPGEREDACGVRLLVDTQVRSEPDFTLITRDIKARYAEYDAVSMEFTDTAAAFSYNGGAVIFNTPDGAYYIGYIYGPPNNKGYIVRAAD